MLTVEPTTPPGARTDTRRVLDDRLAIERSAGGAERLAGSTSLADRANPRCVPGSVFDHGRGPQIGSELHHAQEHQDHQNHAGRKFNRTAAALVEKNLNREDAKGAKKTL